MTGKTISYYIGKYRAVYDGLRPEHSPAIGETVYFNAQGFKHLIFKNNHRRTNAAIRNRLILIPLIPSVIKHCKEVTETRTGIETIKGKQTPVTYKALEANVGKGGARVKVVVKKVGDKGSWYFLSVMKY